MTNTTTVAQTARRSTPVPGAMRCWSWRCCGCQHTDDCLLNRPLKVHDPQPCGGEFGGDGFRAHCTAGSET